MPAAQPSPTTPIRVTRRSSGNRSATNAIGSGVTPSGEIEELPLRIWKPAIGGDAAQRMRQLVVVLSGMGRPAVPVSGDVLQCWRVFIRHAARFGPRTVAEA